MNDELNQYLEKVDFKKQFKKLEKKLSNKTIIIYGAGQLFKVINKKFDLSKLNIIGISDMKFADSEENTEYLGYKVIPKSKIINYKPDYLLIATLKYTSIILSFASLYKDTNIKVKPLVQIPFSSILLDIWGLKFNLFNNFNELYKPKIFKILEYLKVKRNQRYIKNNTERVLKSLKNKVKKGEILKVGFLCNERQKWKCQILYDLFKTDKNFEPVILATRIPSIVQNDEYAVDTYNFFKEKNMNVEYAYTPNNYKHSKDFGCDLIFYQQPWGNETTQGPVVSSKYMLSYYVPYFLPTSCSWIEYGLRFHQYLHKHFLLSDEVKNDFSLKMLNKGFNIEVAGHPAIDEIIQKIDSTKTKNTVIFAPHHSIDDPRTNWSTFFWSGKVVLDFAFAHPEINWIFKPHPYLKTAMLKFNHFMNEAEIKEYWAQWEKIGRVYESGDYFDLFNESCLLITDCGSFLTEYFLFNKPVIHLRRIDSVQFNGLVNKISNTYYNAYNKSELLNALKEIVVNKNDFKKNERINCLNELNLLNNNASLNIINSIKKELNINE